MPSVGRSSTAMCPRMPLIMMHNFRPELTGIIQMTIWKWGFNIKEEEK